MNRKPFQPELEEDRGVFDISARIREIRNEQKISQQVLADRIGITMRSLQNYETHQRKFDSRLMPAIFDALNTSPDEFFQWDSDSHPGEERPPFLIDDILPYLNKMSYDDVEQLYRQICEAKSLLEVVLNTKNKADYRWLLKTLHQKKVKTPKRFIYV